MGSRRNDPVSITILVLLLFICLSICIYLILYIYNHYKSKLDKDIYHDKRKWLENERRPLIPGNFHTEPIQPMCGDNMLENDLDESVDEVDFKERDYSKLGRIIFVMRYHKKREELMIRLVQIEGLPVSHELYNANSAYVDVQLKYIGDSNESEEVQRPPRLDICLQQVYYFIISEKQMLTHSVEFQINTFDDQFRRFVSGMVEVSLNEEMGEDIFTGAEVVFVKEIMEPFTVIAEEDCVEQGKFVSPLCEQEDTAFDEQQIRQQCYDGSSPDTSRPSSAASSHLSWELESRDLLSLSQNSLLNIQPYAGAVSNELLNPFKRSHSIGYLPTYEWTVTDIPLDEDDKEEAVDVLSPMDAQPLNRKSFETTPESFYHIVPVTPLYTSNDTTKNDHLTRRIMFKKQTKGKRLTRVSLSSNKRSSTKQRLESCGLPPLERSSSWPSLNAPVIESGSEVSPEHQTYAFFG